MQIQQNESEQVMKVSAMQLSTKPLDFPINRLIKRSFDLTFSLVVCVTLLSWLLPLIAICIKLDSSGSAFFKQKRHGLNGKVFWCWKLRTMRVDVQKEAFKQTSKYDARITPLGNWLRKTSLDELPQFLNVLLGEMSVVGPRPHPIELNEQYSPMISSLMSRHEVKPGITGLAQASNHRGEIITVNDMKHRIKYDCHYILHWSFWLDLKIIVKTISLLFHGSDNAY